MTNAATKTNILRAIDFAPTIYGFIEEGNLLVNESSQVFIMIKDANLIEIRLRSDEDYLAAEVEFATDSTGICFLFDSEYKLPLQTEIAIVTKSGTSSVIPAGTLVGEVELFAPAGETDQVAWALPHLRNLIISLIVSLQTDTED